jgi:hypothetical protein
MGIDIRELKKMTGERTFLKEMMEIFFQAMLAGYAGDSKKEPIAELPGSKMASPFIRGPWKVVDPFIVTPISSRSVGMTIISFYDIPVWYMQYAGWYEKKAIPCLKAALHYSYEKHEFNGGRGPREVKYGKFVYSNSPNDFYNTFKVFDGSESIHVASHEATCLGVHQYRGGLMI